MIIREAEMDDLNSILEVLRASLGEISSKKNKEVWNYKHISNPFGNSLVLVAEEDHMVIGVRAFMRWQWQFGKKKYKAFRAVDTATHPDHQGKGIFKKLTNEALSIAELSGDHFIFNTPNSQSKPGYLKMGWEEVSKLKIKVIPQVPLSFSNSRPQLNEQTTHFDIKDSLKDLLKSYNEKLILKNRLFTPKSIDYLNWRYCNNKIQNYHVAFDADYFVAGYLKIRGKIRELRISECIFISTPGKRKSKEFIKKLSNQFKPHFISYSSIENLSRIQFEGKFGPVLTFKNINCTPNENANFLRESSWNYTIGDLELF